MAKIKSDTSNLLAFPVHLANGFIKYCRMRFVSGTMVIKTIPIMNVGTEITAVRRDILKFSYKLNFSVLFTFEFNFFPKDLSLNFLLFRFISRYWIAISITEPIYYT